MHQHYQSIISTPHSGSWSLPLLAAVHPVRQNGVQHCGDVRETAYVWFANICKSNLNGSNHLFNSLLFAKTAICAIFTGRVEVLRVEVLLYAVDLLFFNLGRIEGVPNCLHLICKQLHIKSKQFQPFYISPQAKHMWRLSKMLTYLWIWTVDDGGGVSESEQCDICENIYMKMNTIIFQFPTLRENGDLRHLHGFCANVYGTLAAEHPILYIKRCKVYVLCLYLIFYSCISNINSCKDFIIHAFTPHAH